MLVRNNGFKYFIVEMGVSLLFLVIVSILKALHKISDNTFVLSLVLWGLLTPSPYSWYLHVGNFIKAGKSRYGTPPQAKVSNENGMPANGEVSASEGVDKNSRSAEANGKE